MSSNMARFGTYNVALPPEGPRVYPINCDLRTVDQFEIDLTLEVVQGFISFAQSLFIDNTANAGEVRITATGTNQMLRVPAGKQAYLPMFITDEIKLVVEVDAPAIDLIIPIIVGNMPMTPYVW